MELSCWRAYFCVARGRKGKTPLFTPYQDMEPAPGWVKASYRDRLVLALEGTWDLWWLVITTLLGEPLMQWFG